MFKWLVKLHTNNKVHEMQVKKYEPFVDTVNTITRSMQAYLSDFHFSTGLSG
jgi:hypothetical protein